MDVEVLWVWQQAVPKLEERMLVDPKGLRFLFQGRDPKSDGWAYHKLPYRLGLLTQAGN